MTTTTMKQARLDFRTTSVIKSTIEKAAALCGMSVSEFVSGILMEQAQRILEQHETRRLSDRDRDHFLALLEAPAAPNAALLAAAADFKQAVSDKALVP